jgi:2,3-dihydroxybiphenyl 1,2-dioxygenase
MAAVSGLGYVALDVADMPAWLEFAQTVFGMQPLARDDGAVDLRIDDQHHRFTLYPAAQNGVRAIGWEVADRATLDALVASLRERGIEVTEGPAALAADRHVARIVSFREPNLNLQTELFLAPEKSASFAPTREISGYNTGGLGLGHAVFSAVDPKAAVRFYQEVLGFNVSDYIIWEDKDATFLHCNPRHHTLAIMNEFGPLKGGDLNHIMIEAKTFDDVGRAFDIVRDRGYPIMMDLGKHTNDHMQSFYVFTPSGFAIEYGFGGRHIGEGWEVQTYDAPMLFGHRMVAA